MQLMQNIKLATDTINQMEQYMTCTLCQKPFTNPNTFASTCGHTFCRECVYKKLVGVGISTCQCPVCKEPGWVNELQYNTKYSEVQETLAKLSRSVRDLCQGLESEQDLLEQGKEEEVEDIAPQGISQPPTEEVYNSGKTQYQSLGTFDDESQNNPQSSQKQPFYSHSSQRSVKGNELDQNSTAQEDEEDTKAKVASSRNSLSSSNVDYHQIQPHFYSQIVLQDQRISQQGNQQQQQQQQTSSQSTTFISPTLNPNVGIKVDSKVDFVQDQQQYISQKNYSSQAQQNVQDQHTGFNIQSCGVYNNSQNISKNKTDYNRDNNNDLIDNNTYNNISDNPILNKDSQGFDKNNDSSQNQIINISEQANNAEAIELVPVLAQAQEDNGSQNTEAQQEQGIVQLQHSPQNTNKQASCNNQVENTNPVSSVIGSPVEGVLFHVAPYPTPPAKNNICCSNLAKPIEYLVVQTCRLVGNYEFSAQVDESTQVLLVKCNSDQLILHKTQKFYESTIRGCYVLNHQWLLDSIQNNDWLPPNLSKYRAVSRVERESQGYDKDGGQEQVIKQNSIQEHGSSSIKVQSEDTFDPPQLRSLFKHKFFILCFKDLSIENENTQMSHTVQKLITLGGGKFVQQRQLYDDSGLLDEVERDELVVLALDTTISKDFQESLEISDCTAVAIKWLFDCISAHKIIPMDYHKYIATF